MIEAPTFQNAKPRLAARLMAAALATLGIPRQRTDYGFQRFGRDGEFAVEEIREEIGSRWRGGWRLEHKGTQLALYTMRARAFEAAAEIARKRGDSVNDCARLLGGVRW